MVFLWLIWSIPRSKVIESVSDSFHIQVNIFRFKHGTYHAHILIYTEDELFTLSLTTLSLHLYYPKCTVNRLSGEL